MALGLPRGLALAGCPSLAVLGAEVHGRERARGGCGGAESWAGSLSLGQSHRWKVALGPE